MQYRTLGTTDIQVSAIALGGWTFGGGATWGDADEAESIATIHAAIDAGITFLDTAEGYGNSEIICGKALVGRRADMVIATKVGQRNLAPDDVRAACDTSLRRLQTDYIDLYQIHWPSRAVPLADTWGALERLRDEGKIRAIGVSNFGVGDLADLRALGHAETNQLPYNLLWRAIEFDILPACQADRMGILCYSALAQGLLTGKFASADAVPPGRARTKHFSKDRPETRHAEAGAEAETFAAIAALRQISQRLDLPMADVALAWLLHQPGVTSVLAGARTPQQVRQNAAAADVTLSADILAELDAMSSDLKARLGSDPDMWSSESRFR